MLAPLGTATPVYVVTVYVVVDSTASMIYVASLLASNTTPPWGR
jgi:hypothetical protein